MLRYMLELDKNNKTFTISTISKEPLFLLKLTILKNELLFYINNNIKNLLFSTIYICPHFFYKNLLFYITNILLTFLKLQKN